MMREWRKFMLYGSGIVIFLTAVLGLAANVGLFGEQVRASSFSSWAVSAVIAEIVGVTIAAYKNLLGTIEYSILVALDFQSQIPPTDFDYDKCTYSIKRVVGTTKTGRADMFQDEDTGHWKCVLPPYARSDDLVRLNLTDIDGRNWRVPQFRISLETTRQVR